MGGSTFTRAFLRSTLNQQHESTPESAHAQELKPVLDASSQRSRTEIVYIFGSPDQSDHHTALYDSSSDRGQVGMRQ